MPTNKKYCTDLFAHSIGTMKTVSITSDTITKQCSKCGYREELPRSKRNLIFVNANLQQTKKWAADDNRKEVLQPLDAHGNENEDFTEAYGFNPFNETTKAATPKIQGGLA